MKLVVFVLLCILFLFNIWLRKILNIILCRMKFNTVEFISILTLEDELG